MKLLTKEMRYDLKDEWDREVYPSVTTMFWFPFLSPVSILDETYPSAIKPPNHLDLLNSLKREWNRSIDQHFTWKVSANLTSVSQDWRRILGVVSTKDSF